MEQEREQAPTGAALSDAIDALIVDTLRDKNPLHYEDAADDLTPALTQFIAARDAAPPPRREADIAAEAQAEDDAEFLAPYDRDAAAAGQVADEPPWAGCTGANTCGESWHIHGCYADDGKCDDPLDHHGQVADTVRALPDRWERRYGDRPAAYFEGLDRAAADLRAALPAAPPPRREADIAAEAWDEGYVAGHAFGYEWAQDTYDGPTEDPTVNPYRPAALREAGEQP